MELSDSDNSDEAEQKLAGIRKSRADMKKRSETGFKASSTSPEKRRLKTLLSYDSSKLLKSLADPIQLRNKFETLHQPKDDEANDFHRNTKKNRYKDILCLDSTRIMLGPKKDYIHANMPYSTSLKANFILTQGPIDSTILDFWSMIWQEDVTTIVMLCNFVEANVSKCSNYYPKFQENKIFSLGQFYILATSETNIDGLVSTQIVVHKGKASRDILHMRYKNWPDHDTPSIQSYAVIDRMCTVVEKRNSSGTIVIHCSAGVGRTGTLVAILMARNNIVTGQTLDIYSIVNQIKKVRCLAVQTFNQYKYIIQYAINFIKKKIDSYKNSDSATTDECDSDKDYESRYKRLLIKYNTVLDSLPIHAFIVTEKGTFPKKCTDNHDSPTHDTHYKSIYDILVNTAELKTCPIVSREWRTIPEIDKIEIGIWTGESWKSGKLAQHSIKTSSHVTIAYRQQKSNDTLKSKISLFRLCCLHKAKEFRIKSADFAKITHC